MLGHAAGRSLSRREPPRTAEGHCGPPHIRARSMTNVAYVYIYICLICICRSPATPRRLPAIPRRSSAAPRRPLGSISASLRRPSEGPRRPLIDPLRSLAAMTAAHGAPAGRHRRPSAAKLVMDACQLRNRFKYIHIYIYIYTCIRVAGWAQDTIHIYRPVFCSSTSQVMLVIYTYVHLYTSYNYFSSWIYLCFIM